MSVTFYVARDSRIDHAAPSLNLANANAADLLQWLQLPTDEYGPYGDISARELAARCRRRLWDVARNHDPELPGLIDRAPGHATVIFNGRRAGYLREKTAELLRVAEAAGEGLVAWA